MAFMARFVEDVPVIGGGRTSIVHDAPLRLVF